jgi:hypothetical protein
VIAQALPHLLGRATDSRFAARIAPADLSITGGAAAIQTGHPIPLFIADLSDLGSESFPSKAKPNGWRYVVSGVRPIGFADVRGEPSGDKAQFNSLVRGAIVDRLVAAAQIAEKQHGNDSDTYEARVLEAPSVHVAAYWLHGSRDIFFPFVVGTPSSPERIDEDPDFIKNVMSRASQLPRGPTAPAKL